MRRTVRFALPLSVLATLSGAARADLPNMPLDTLLASTCKDALAAVNCPTCACEAVTATPPNDWSTVSDLTHALAVRVYGELSPGRLANRYLVVVGSAKGFAYAGVLGDGSLLKDTDLVASVEVVGARSTMDMCPGDCPHAPVGPVHFFEVKRTSTVTDENYIDTVTATETLVACFEKGGALGCWQVPLGEEVTRVKPQLEPGDKAKVFSKGSWKRKWSVGGEVGMQLVLAKATTKGKHNLADHPEIVPSKTFFENLAALPGVTPLPR